MWNILNSRVKCCIQLTSTIFDRKRMLLLTQCLHVKTAAILYYYPQHFGEREPSGAWNQQNYI